MDGWQVNDDLEGKYLGLIEVLSWIILGGTEKNTINISRIIDVPVRIESSTSKI
jgi:hypothetical protein